MNPLCTRLAIQRPIILAPMGGAVGPEMAALISNLGGLGTIPLWRADENQIKAAVTKIQSQTDKPFAVNLNMSFPHQHQIGACLEAGVPVISLFWGDSVEAIKQVKDGGAIAVVTVGCAAEATVAIEAGADVIVAQGFEAGGHVWGDVTTLALVPAVVDVAGDVPVVAAGGISDARAVAAAYALGATGVWVGTRFLAAEELQIHDTYRQAVLEAGENDSFHAHDLFDVGWPDAPHRAIKNSTYDAWVAAGKPASGSRPNEGQIIAKNGAGADVKRYQSATPGPNDTGEIEALSMWIGQGAAQVRSVMPAAHIMDELDQGAQAVLDGLGSAG